MSLLELSLLNRDQHVLALWRQLLSMNRALKHTLHVMHRNTDVSHSGMAVLSRLEHDGKMRMNDIADFLGITLGSATSTVDKLEIAGYVARSRTTEDRRVIYVQLTERGVKALDDIRELFSREAQYIFGDLAVSDIEALTEAAKTLELRLGQYHGHEVL